MDGDIIMTDEQYKWYNLGYGHGAVNLQELNEVYCIEFYNVFKRYPSPTFWDRPRLLNEIRKLQQIAKDDSRSSAHSG